MATKAIIEERIRIIRKIIQQKGFTKKVDVIKYIKNSEEISTKFKGLSQRSFERIISFEEAPEDNNSGDDLENIEEASTETGTGTSGYDNVKITDRLKHECEKYGLPLEAVSSYKWVNHTGQQVLNIAFHPNFIADDRSMDKRLEDLEKSLKEKYPNPLKIDNEVGIGSKIVIINIADLHVGMNPNKDGNSIWDASWDRDDIMVAANNILKKIAYIIEVNGGCSSVVVNLNGDLVDGFDKLTTRGGHQLPQTMNNIQQNDVCLEFLCRITEGLKSMAPKVFFKANSNSNHGGEFEHIILSHFRSIAKMKYDVDVELTNKLALGYMLPGTNKPIVIMHGKDQEFQSRPLPSHIEDKDDFKVEAIINAVHKNRVLKPIIFKGDSHIFNHQEKKNYQWVACAACSPDSDWAKNNFYNNGKGNCTIAIYHPNLDLTQISNIPI